MPEAPARGVRARVRGELTEQIKGIARHHLAARGAPALSLRAVAREAGMVSSGVYRYFASRDDLLTALIVDAFDAVGEAAEEADAGCDRADLDGRWLAVARAVRTWALSNPHEYALVYGSPVPGYTAPTDTVDPAGRVSLVFLRILADGVGSGSIATGDRIETTRVLRQDLARLRSVGAPGVPDSVLSRGLLVWTQLFGAISYELFGHLHRVITDYDALFELQARRAGELLLRGLREAP
ncbi:MAG: TetR/AcrR family transcriptional regulator [Microthrixaceae bacterium]